MGRRRNNRFPPQFSQISHKPSVYHQTSWSWPLPGQNSRCCSAKKGSSYQTSDHHPHFKGGEPSSEAHSAYLEHIISLERPNTSMQRTLLLGCNYPSGADVPTWRPVQKGASCPPSISCISTSPVFPHPISLEAGIWEQGGKRGTQQCQSTEQFMARLYLTRI